MCVLSDHARKVAGGDESLAFVFFHYLDDQYDYKSPPDSLPSREELEAACYNRNGKWWCSDYHRGLYFGWNAQGVLCAASYDDQRPFVEGLARTKTEWSQPVFSIERWRYLIDDDAQYVEHLKQNKPELLPFHDQRAFTPKNRLYPGHRFYYDGFWSEKPIDITHWAPIDIWHNHDAVRAWSKPRED